MISNIKPRFTSILLVLGLFLLSYSSLAITPWLFSDETFHLYKYLFRALLISASALILIIFIQLTVRQVIPKKLKNIILLLGSILLAFYVLELIFMFIPISTGGADSLCSKNWFQYHWRENELGYRDGEVLVPPDNAKKNLLIIGDSYVAGHGIDNPSDRFSDILGDRLKETMNTFNLGVCGIDTQEEYERMLKYPIEPDILILVHTPNDIRSAVSNEMAQSLLGFKKISDVIPDSDINRSFIKERSFLVNFIWLNYSNYRQTLTSERLRDSFQSFEQFLKSDISKSHLVSYYNNESVLKIHLAHVNEFIQYTRNKDKTLIVLLFPWLNKNNFDISNEYMNAHLERYLNKNKTRVINLHSILEGIGEEDRIVGHYDNHPSELVHQLVADHLTQYINQLNTKPN